MIRRGALWLLLLVAGGCGWFGSKDVMQPRGPDLGEIVRALPAPEAAVAAAPTPRREDVMAAYQRIYGQMPDQRQDQAVGKRLADLEMHVGEDRDIAGEADPYRPAIELYESLLDRGGAEAQDEILYQLARAYDLAGREADSLRHLDRLIAEHADSAYRLEAHFRRAELAFSRERYDQASADYGYVVAQGPDTAYWRNAHYMRGWAQFKRAELEEGLDSFFTVIDSLLEGGDADALATTDRELLEDSFRVVTLALGYLEGPTTLAEQMNARGRPSWQYLAYERLARDYHQRERYLDSVATWQAFVEQNPLDARAPSAHLGMIDTLIEADFPSEVQPTKVSFVRRYGIRSEFWQVHDAEVRDAYLQPLRSFLEELARAQHARAQASAEPADYKAAASWYEERVATFPDSPDTAEYLFLLGEVYTEAGEPGQAVAAYQRVVREFPDFPDAHEAGYAAILGLEAMTRDAPADEAELWQRVKIDAQIEFAFVFAGDPRAPAVQTDAADGLFALGEHAAAVALAANLLDAWPDVEWPLRRTALSILGHGHFELGDFPAAERAYRLLLAGPVSGDERGALTDRLLASVYRQAENAEQNGDPDQAVGHYLRLSELAPGAELAVQGHFDAVAVAETAGQTARAAELLATFRDQHTGHPLAADAGKRLAALYEQTGDLMAAADELAALAEGDPDVEVRRLARYRAAELYLAEGADALAREQLVAYVDHYPSPLPERLEAVQQLDDLARGDDAGRRPWLREKIAIHRQMGSGAGERATYLAAQAQFLLAQEVRTDFELIRLGHPLPNSLARKQEALKSAVAALEAAAAYEVAEFATASTFQIATLFTDLAGAIMASDRPDGLSALELEQYEILLEEQAFPFEEQAIALHEINMRRSWDGLWNDWIERSFAELGRLMPARFDKPEVEVAYVETIH
ncbi:MAG: tetratricopeptide repeat protein [bacterium]